MASLVDRVLRKLTRIRYTTGGRLRSLRQYQAQVQGRRGLEIGGPSDVFRPGQALCLYPVLGSLDNCNFSKSTVWAQQADAFIFSDARPAGTSIFCEGSDLATVSSASYDFVLSSHNLEHFANPVKALVEWRRVLRPGGTLVLALPDHRRTFDHRRTPTAVDHLMDDWRADTGEDDLTHLDEILEKHDRSMDAASGTAEFFRERSMRNIENRCLHHHVFSPQNSRELLKRTGFDVDRYDLADPNHILLLARVRDNAGAPA